MRTSYLLAVFFACLLLCPGTSFAHTSSESFLALTVEKQSVRGTWSLSLRDLEYVVGIDQNGDGEISWGEVQGKQKEIERFALSGVSVGVPGVRCPLSVTDLLVDKRSDGSYASLEIAGSCLKPLSEGIPITVEYSLFFDSNPQHRGLLQIRSGTGMPKIFIFSPENRNFIFSREKEPGDAASFAQLFHEGIWHIWTGYDHILFLLALLLPSVLVRKDDHWIGAENFREILFSVLKVVTAFTVAHSITLALAAMKIVHLPSRFVESTIALSVALAALNNIIHAVHERKLWWVAFVFGLIHGFGFAGVMSEFGLEGSLLLTTVLSFNLGVEIGQIAIVLSFLPFAYFLRRTRFYRWVILWGGSFSIALLAWRWMLERLFDY